MLTEDGGNRPAPNIAAQICERALDAGVAPIAILRRHVHHELLNLGDRRWPWPAALMTVVLSGDEMAMPGEQGVRRSRHVRFLRGRGGAIPALFDLSSPPSPSAWTACFSANRISRPPSEHSYLIS